MSSQTEAQFVPLCQLYADAYATGYACNLCCCEHSFLRFSLFVMEDTEFAVLVHLTERYELGEAFKIFSDVPKSVG